MKMLIIGVKRSFVRLLLLILLWIGFGMKYLRNSRYSWFYQYQFDQNELHEEMSKQLNDSKMFWNKLLNEKKNSLNNDSNDICSVIISSPRHDHPTLYYTISSLINSMNFKDKFNEKVFIYNTGDPPQSNIYAHQLSQSKISSIKVINSSKFHLNLKEINFESSYDQWIWNESIDYLFALSICDQLNWKYLLIFQDDLIFTKNFYSKLRSYLNENLFDCISIRLFRSDFWDGWQFEDLPFLILLSFPLSTIVLLLNLLMDNQRCFRSSWLNIRTDEKLLNVYPCPILFLLSIWLIWLIVIFLMIISLNRQHLLSIFVRRAGIYRMESSVSGALARLYPRWMKRKVENYLENRLKECQMKKRAKAIDDLLNEFFESESSQWSECHLIPDLVDHIGVYSSSLRKNQGDFLSMKTSGTFIPSEASIDFT